MRPLSLKPLTISKLIIWSAKAKLVFNKFVYQKMINIIATRCYILRLKCIKFDFGWDSAPDPAGGAHSSHPDPLAGLKGSYF